jgi:tRNA(Arg) A34 adenosine deaminase TadA
LNRGAVYKTPKADLSLIENLSQRDYRWTQRAIGIALTSSHSYRMGALAVRGGTIIGYSVNKFRNHPRIVTNWYDCSVHAEQSLSESCDLSGTLVYVARVNPQGKASLAKPCKVCLQILVEGGVKRVIWTETEDHVGMLSLG